MDLARELATWKVGSASAAVIGPEGVRDLHDDGERRPWASVTKIASALTLLDACAEGVVHLEDEVGPPAATLRHLLAHTSGVDFDTDQVKAPPGTRRIYSNTGIELAAAHLERATGQSFAQELQDRVLDLLDMTGCELTGPPSHGMVGPIGDLARLAHELLAPRLLLPQAVELGSTLAFPGMDGVLPGYGRQRPNDWGLGFEIRDAKSPHWTSPDNSPRTFGHFGQSGSFLWVDPDAQLGCVSLSDKPFGSWAIEAWPPFSTHVLQAHRA